MEREEKKGGKREKEGGKKGGNGVRVFAFSAF